MVVFSGWQTKFRISNTLAGLTGSSLAGVSLDGVTRVSVEYGTGVKAVGQVGGRAAYAIIEGRIDVSGTIERYFTGSGILGFVRGTNETGSIGVTPNFGIYPNGEVSGQPYEAIQGIKFSNYRTQSKPGSALKTEVLDFIGTRLWTGSLP